VDVKGEILQLKNTINAMVDQLNSFASEVTRVAREVGSEGRLGGQAQVRGVAGVWKDLTDNVNSMAGNLTSQVRGIAKVVTAVANGDLKRKLIVEAKGEIGALSDTINEMIDTLATFADQVTSVAREVGVEGQLGGQAKVPGAAGTWKGLTENVNQLAANLTTQVRAIAEVATAVTKGDLTRSITVVAQGEVAALKDNINEMIRNLKDTTQKNTEQDWLKTNLAKFTRMLQGQRDLMAVTKLILSELAPVVQAQHGVFYVMDGADGEAPTLKLTSTYAYRERRGLRTEFRVGEGLVGQCAFERERILIADVPGDYVRISSGLGEAPPLNIVVLPVIFEGQVKAVIELASFHRFTEIHLSLLDQLTETIAIVLNTIAANMRTEALLKQSQSLAEELTSQQEELRETNTRLEKQAASLRASEDLLRRQQDELKRANEELETKAGQLSTQKARVEGKNREIELAKQELEEKAEQLALTSKYKSEFLANMSHELRTPLNSLLILAEMLADDAAANLSAKQREFAQTIHASGSDLLSLINDILDMAKIESGTMAVDVSDVPFTDLRDYVERTFGPVAETKDLALEVELAEGLPRAIATDAKRLQQVLRNLLSNAFKFTEDGTVNLRVGMATGGWSADHPALGRAGEAVAFAVSDTGIGIPADKLKIIFEPFQQADTGTSRKYGGTGLGLSISREIAHLLGGEIRVQSTPGEGSTFTLFLPLSHVPAGHHPATGPGRPAWVAPPRPRRAEGDWRAHEATSLVTPRAEPFADHRDAIEPGDHVILIVEHEPRFAGILVDKAHELGFKAVATSSGEAALELAHELRPAAITLDLRLPDMDGWVVLDRLKHDHTTRHIPVHIISVDDSWQRGMRLGAFAFLKKPVSRKSLDEALSGLKGFLERGVRELLVVEDNELERGSIVAAIGDGDVRTTAVGTAAAALEALRARPFDCLVLDLGLPDMGGLELLEQVKRELNPQGLRVVVYTARDLTPQEQARLDEVAESTIVKDVRSLEHLVDKTALFLHRVESGLRPEIRRMLHQGQMTDPDLAGKKVLIVDDDLRNIFALTSKLERWGMVVLRAENGRLALELLERSPDVDLVLMDIMMPEMDGYETMRSIRAREAFRGLPIVALTAKAMKEDRQKCIDAGASDYLAKPVGGEQLLSTLRVWLRRRTDRAGELGKVGRSESP
jgi:signal transduction histidine kinase/CheY-like chemotaxis protein/HAMP domain-containing protein